MPCLGTPRTLSHFTHHTSCNVCLSAGRFHGPSLKHYYRCWQTPRLSALSPSCTIGLLASTLEHYSSSKSRSLPPSAISLDIPSPGGVHACLLHHARYASWLLLTATCPQCLMPCPMFSHLNTISEATVHS